MTYGKKIFVILILAAAILSSYGLSLAFDDGFGSAKKIDGKNVIVYLTPDIDIAGLNNELNIRPSDKILAGKSIKSDESPEKELVDMLDTLYLEVCEITDMRLYSLQVDVKICRDQAQLNSIYDNLFKMSLGDKRSFYVYTLNTVYISADSFKKEIIGHEIAHAVICHYFVVPPSVKIQEVLAMYVEYNLRKPAK